MKNNDPVHYPEQNPSTDFDAPAFAALDYLGVPGKEEAPEYYPGDTFSPLPSCGMALPDSPEEVPLSLPSGQESSELPKGYALPEAGRIFSSPEYARIRFLHAAVDYPPVSVVVGSQLLEKDLSYGMFSDWEPVPEGFRTITIVTRSSPRQIIFRQYFPFSAGEAVTLAMANSPNGAQIVPVPERRRLARPTGISCFRVADLSYNSPPLDLTLSDGRLIFSDIRFKEVSALKQILPQEYEFCLLPTPMVSSPLEDIEALPTSPIPILDTFLPGHGDSSPLLSFSADVAPATTVTAYILGSASDPPYLQAHISVSGS